jgi:hypothetical protein
VRGIPLDRTKCVLAEGSHSTASLGRSTMEDARIGPELFVLKQDNVSADLAFVGSWRARCKARPLAANRRRSPAASTMAATYGRQRSFTLVRFPQPIGRRKSAAEGSSRTAQRAALEYIRTPTAAPRVRGAEAAAEKTRGTRIGEPATRIARP